MRLVNPFQVLLLINAFVGSFVESFMDAYEGAKPTQPGSAYVCTVRCPCGEIWTYCRPRNYGGNAFRNLRCPECGGSQQKLQTG